MPVKRCYVFETGFEMNVEFEIDHAETAPHIRRHRGGGDHVFVEKKAILTVFKGPRLREDDDDFQGRQRAP